MCEPAYLAWCQQHGITTHGVRPAFVTQGWRGVVSTQRLAAGDVIMRVPQALLLSVVAARRDPQLAAQLVQHQQLSSHQVLVLHLLHEASKGAASFWAPYTAQLPRTYTTLMAWPPDAVAALQLQHAQAAAVAALDSAKAEWAQARPVLRALGADSKWASWRAWVWAASCVLSRTMYHPDDPPCGCLTPLADLHNYAPPAAPFTPDVARDMQALLAGMPAAGGHGQQQRATQEQAPNRRVPTPACAATDAAGGHAATAADGKHSGTDAAADAAASPPEPAASQQQQTGSTQQCSSNGSSGDGFFDAHGGVYTIVARRSYEPGEQVFLTYGRHTNLELLQLYGFLLPDNPHDTALLPPSLLQAQLQAALERQLQQQAQQRQQALPHWRLQQPRQQRAYKHQQQQPLQQQQQQGWRAVQLDVAEADCWVHVPSGQPGWQLLSALRLAAAPPAEARALAHRALQGAPVSLQSERLALAALAGACGAQLAALPSSADEDARLLATAGACGSDDRGRQTGRGRDGGASARAVCCAETRAAAGVRETQGGARMSACCGRAGEAPAPMGSCQAGHACHARAAAHSGQTEGGECVHLAVAWRVTYKRALLACVRHCEGALAAAAAAAAL